MSFFRLQTGFAVCSRCRRYATKAGAQVNISAAASSAASAKVAKKPSASRTTAIPQSSCPADTILTGVNYLKGQPPVLALPEDQYPEWLWTILESKVYPDDGPGGKAERVKRRLDNKQRIKERNFMSTQ
ncbi:hypothetical protein M378DRAFT_185837 [Amanita muscaria Koide BX008]|uniref:Large ribosomal subunit protein mL54 n=1 Tax=Amanita muscaria (strain Koide BX008) TaxID=946122 RepID=A0A0C2TJG3_AMAMK|nr:hypothetical protein M378DRAFT_185837 [Amanita muscaria Koide BX008]